MIFHCVAVAKKQQSVNHTQILLFHNIHHHSFTSKHTLDSLQQKYSNNDTISNHIIIYSSIRIRGIKNKLYIKSADLQTNMRSFIGLHLLPSHTLMRKGFISVFVCLSTVCVRYLQQARAPREVWLSKLLSVSEVMVGSLLGSVGSVDMDDTSLAEEEEEDVG